ncbi:MAG: hypothetical protein AB1610_01050 [Nitrospirota bacterium]
MNNRSQESRVRSQKIKNRNLLLTFYYISLTICCLLIAGCVSTPPVLSDSHQKGIYLNQKGEDAFKKGDYNRALYFYNEALKISHSIENTDSIAINLINMAIVYRKLNDATNAHKCADEISNTSNIEYHPSQLSGAAFIKAMLYMDEKKYTDAEEWADKALSFCENNECLTEGRIYNLKARLALLNGDLNSAIIYGTKGLDLNKGYKDHKEVANSIRIIADAKIIMNKYEEAKRLYEDALSLDKNIGLSKKIALDLIGIGTIYFKQEMFEDALKYYQRAFLVSEGAEDQEGISRATDLINKCMENLKSFP